MQKLNKNVKNIAFIIYPTEWQDFDVCAIGYLPLLKKIAKKDKNIYLAKQSKFGGTNIIVFDTCNTLRDALNCIKKYKDLYARPKKNT